MKKLVFAFVAVVALSFASCGNKTQSTPSTTDSTDTTQVDTLAGDSVAAPADTTVAQ